MHVPAGNPNIAGAITYIKEPVGTGVPNKGVLQAIIQFVVNAQSAALDTLNPLTVAQLWVTVLPLPPIMAL